MNIQGTGSGLCSGLTRNLIKDFNRINVGSIEAEFQKIGVDADFKNSKLFSGSCKLVQSILYEASQRFHLPLDVLPPSIRVFRNNDLLDDSGKCSWGFCIIDTAKVLKNEQEFEAGSLFFKKHRFDSVIISGLQTMYSKARNYCSSPHFLAHTLHEWFHTININQIYKKFGYEGEGSLPKAKYYRANATGIEKIEDYADIYIYPQKRRYLEKNFGQYSAETGSLLEMFAEVMTQITTKSLNKNLKLVNNPLDYLPKNMPRFLRRFIEENLEI